MSEIRKHTGVYFVRDDRTIDCHERLPAAEMHNLERLRFQVITFNGMPPRSFWGGTYHGNEEASAIEQQKINSQYEFSRVESWICHELAAQTVSREYVVPMNGHNNTIPGRVIRLENGRLGKVVDLNRQYEMPLVLATDWDSIIGNIAYGPARLPLQLIRHNPTVKAVVSIHEDVEHNSYPYPFVKYIPRIKKQDGFYLYDIKAHPNDPRDEIVDRQMVLLRHALKARGFTLYNGVDDSGDPHLGNKVDHGLVRQAVYGVDGHPHLDNTLELFLVYLQTLGLTNVERAFIPEVPGKLSRDKKKTVAPDCNRDLSIPCFGGIGSFVKCVRMGGIVMFTVAGSEPCEEAAYGERILSSSEGNRYAV